MKGGSTRIAATKSPEDHISDQTTSANDNAPVVVNLTFPTDYLDSLPLQTPRLLTKQQAAAYCAVSPETFDDYRRRGIVPDPVKGTNRWDRKLIDNWLDKASGLASPTASPLDEWRSQRDG